ncbi:MAG: hypothetical protein RLZZ527_281 [Actinomycetota bacterium]
MPINFDGLPVETQQLLQERYGLRKRSGWRIVAFAIALIALPWLISTAWQNSNPAFRATLIKFQPIDNRSLSLTFDLSRRDPSAAVECTLVARDIDKNVVGELEVLIEPTDQSLVRTTAVIPTRLPPVNGAIFECRSAPGAGSKRT